MGILLSQNRPLSGQPDLYERHSAVGRFSAYLKMLASFAGNRDALGLGYQLQFDSPYALEEPLNNFFARSGLKHNWMLFLRGLIAPQMTLDWLDLWQSPMLLPLKESHPRVLLKLVRQYLQCHLRPEQRWEALRNHYSFVLKTFQAAALKEIFSCPGALLAELPVDEVGQFSIRLVYDNLFEKEGELSLLVHDEQKKAPLFAMTFCVSSNQPGRRKIFVGGLQGCPLARDHDLIVAITRGIFGLRPKAALLFALQQLAFVWNVPTIRGVSNQNRVLPPDNQPIHADYDQFWIESGGQLDSDTNFTLPVAPSLRPISEIKPNKRAMYRRRYEFLDRLGEQLRKNTGRLGGGGENEN